MSLCPDSPPVCWRADPDTTGTLAVQLSPIISQHSPACRRHRLPCFGPCSHASRAKAVGAKTLQRINAPLPTPSSTLAISISSPTRPRSLTRPRYRARFDVLVAQHPLHKPRCQSVQAASWALVFIGSALFQAFRIKPNRRPSLAFWHLRPPHRRLYAGKGRHLRR